MCRVLAKWGSEATPEAYMEYDHCLLRILLPRTLKVLPEKTTHKLTLGWSKAAHTHAGS